ncbi:unnamed protein product [Adineta steineri]|uniref:RING-type domain-containing protein n=1 Tax=Adineta steineri TaxID=433720 RepID=A0A813YCJ3_9BILA|nr:unnamed protein product [Adineta steineri]CAF0882159.1 unnamed protein product [Adineta steineri]CAF0893073.1 unnamed protein product [Adineta steineri]
MEEEHSSMNNNSNEFIHMTSSLNSRRLQIRRGILRHTSTYRSSPYNSSLSNLRQRQTSQAISNLITNIENPMNIDTSINDDQEEIEIVENNFHDQTDNEHENNHQDVFTNVSNITPVDLTVTNENNDFDQEQDLSYQSLSTVDFDPDDDNEQRFYYTSTSIPIYDYSSTTEPLIIQNHHNIDTIEHRYYDEYSPSIIDDDNDDDEDLSIEIILESSQNNSLSSIPISTSRRRRSIIPSNIRGLRSSDILSIPQKIYSSLKQQINDKHQQTILTNTQCYICLEDFQSIDSIKILNCQHIFHTHCINEWLRNHSNCAYCRTAVRIDLLRSSSTTTGQRRRIRPRRNNHSISRSSTNDSIQQISNESSILE